jgi:Fe-S-cluster-containing dehydrogenase component
VKVSRQYPQYARINISPACTAATRRVTACPLRPSPAVVDGRVTVTRPSVSAAPLHLGRPFNAPQIGADGKTVKCHCPDGCWHARPCEEVCPTGALMSGTMRELDEKARQDRKRRFRGRLGSMLRRKAGTSVRQLTHGL